MLQTTHSKQNKGEMRRRQVIDAAADCFRQEGFHGTSIARISKASGMSPGHIYHYFDTKEQIVEALVEQEENELADLLLILKEEQPEADFVDSVVQQIDIMLERILAPSHVTLMLEIAAEAARNPRIAAILQESDRRLAQQFAGIAQTRDAASLGRLDDPESLARLEMLPLLLSGVAHRSIHNPNTDRRHLASMIKTVLTTLWRQDRDR